MVVVRIAEEEEVDRSLGFGEGMGCVIVAVGGILFSSVSHCIF